MKRILCIATVVTAALALGACGGDDNASSPAASAAGPGAAPQLRSPALFSVERRRGDVAIGETLTVGADGSAVIVRAGGGGGRRTERCRIGTAMFTQLRDEAPVLPAPTPTQMRKVENPAIYVLTLDGRHAVFMDGAIPPAVRPFVAHVKGVLSGRWAQCTNVAEQRR